MITIKEKTGTFLQHTINAFDSKNINEARQAAEAFCKLVILKEYGESEGTQILENTHSTIKYSFDNAIQSIIFGTSRRTGLIQDKRPKAYLLVLQSNGNPSSHDDDHTILTEKEKTYTLLNLAFLSEWLYAEYLHTPLPSKLRSFILTLQQDLVEPLLNENEKVSWEEIKNITQNFNETLQRYVLISDSVEQSHDLEHLAYIPWSYVADFDSQSDINGLLSSVSNTLQKYRDVNRLTINNTLEYKRNTVFWDFVNGFASDNSTITDNSKLWQKKYVFSNKIRNHLENLYKGGISSADIYIFVFWENFEKLQYIIDFINIIDDVFSTETTVFFCSSKQKIIDRIHSEQKDYENFRTFYTYEFSIRHFSLLLHNNKKLNNNFDLLLPALIEGQETEIEISKNDYLQYIDTIQLLSKNIQTEFVECNHFYRGNQINTNFLNQECDIKRDVGRKIEIDVISGLKQRDQKLIYLLSEPSAGSSTIINRIAWDTKERFPSLQILDYSKKRTYEFIQKLYTLTSKPIMIYIDHNIKEDAVKNLISELNSKSISYVILYVIRFLNRADLNQQYRKLSAGGFSVFKIEETLSQKESNAIYNKLAQLNIERQEDLVGLHIGYKNSLFKYCFTTFLDEYNKLDDYIKNRVDILEGRQKKRLMFLALVQYFTGDEISLYFLTNKVQKNSLFFETDTINSLIIYNEINEDITIKIIHNLISEKLLILFSRVEQQKAWQQKLVDMALEFLKFIEENHSHTKNNDQIMEIINRLFIKRVVTSYDSEDQGPQRYYTDLIECLSTDAKEQIFTYLSEMYPENSHIQAHLGRFYSVDRQNLSKALKYINKAIEIAENQGNNDSILYHIKGMAYFRAMKYDIRMENNIDEIIELAKQASEYFIISRESDTQSNNEYPFVSHARALLYLLKYGTKRYGNIENFIQEYKNDDFIVDIIDNLESLISDFELVSSGRDEYNDMKQIQNQLWELQGDIGNSLSMLNNMLAKNTFYNPSIRRNIVRLNIKKFNENINSIPTEKVTQLLSHLDKNIENVSLKNLNSADLLLWLKLIRHKDIDLDILKILDSLTHIDILLKDEEQLTKIQKDLHILIIFYLYILKFIQYYNGNNELLTELIQLTKQLQSKSVFIEGNRFPREWLSSNKSESIKKIIHRFDARLAWDKEEKFFKKPGLKHLEKCEGTIHEVKNQKAGTILYNNLHVYFIPKSEFTKSDLNKTVEFYLSFSYDGLQAWNVQMK
ncbi:tetratricopeptide repeat protein [Thiomicrolovo sp. ZZH C-3]